ncbi:lasso RiPP family leader peptide-containing protein [Streptacidiphilus sp. EB129]
MQDQHDETEVYEPPMLVEVGEFGDMTLGFYEGVSTDTWYTYYF